MDETPDLPADLSPEDRHWARDTAAMMITTALTLADESDTDPEAVYRSARSALLGVRTDDGRAADRWMLVMHLISAHVVRMLAADAARTGVPARELWAAELLRRQS